MVLRHLAAIFLFSGPLFYLGLLLALDPAGIPTLLHWIVGTTIQLGKGKSPGDLDRDCEEVPTPVRRALRLAGLALLVLAVLV